MVLCWIKKLMYAVFIIAKPENLAGVDLHYSIAWKGGLVIVEVFAYVNSAGREKEGPEHGSQALLKRLFA